jgi:hypothetical protein
VVVCGDFNSQPEEGVRELLVKGAVYRDHSDWLRAARFRLIESRAEREANWFKQPNSGEGKGGGGEGGQEDADTEAEGILFGAEEGGADLACDVLVNVRLEQACEDVSVTFCTATNSQVVDYIYYTPTTLMPDPTLSPFPPHTMESLTANTAIPSGLFFVSPFVFYCTPYQFFYATLIECCVCVCACGGGVRL